MHKGLFTSLILAFAALLGSCKPDPDPYPVPASSGKRVLVVCEGMLGQGNAALTLYLPDSNRATDDVYHATNKLGLGDIFQSITRIGNRYFLCINNSDRVLVINRDNFRLEGNITIPKPRYILPISDTKAYVSTLFSDQVYVINPATMSVTGRITLPFRNPEGMVRIGETAYICPWDTAAGVILPVHTGTDSIGTGIAVAGRAPQEVLQDADGMLWVLSGNKASGVSSKLTRLNPATGAVLRSFSFGTADPVRPVFNKRRDTLYFIEVSYSGGSTDNGVYRMGINDNALPGRAFVPAVGFQYFWGIGIDPLSGNIYVADPVGFTQRGKTYVFRPDGTSVATFYTGVGPGHFFFD